MEHNQSLVDNAAPPAYEDSITPQRVNVQIPPGQPGYSTQPQQGYNPQGQQGYPPQSVYPPQGQSGYPPQGQSGYTPQGQSGYPPQGQPGYPPQSQTGYPPNGPPGYPQQGYHPNGQPWYPLQQQQPMPTNISTSTNVTVVQAGCPVVAVYPSDNSGLAWFTCLCCFWPLGIAALIYSQKARDAIDQGDLPSALQYSRQSRNMSQWAIGVHIFLIIVVPIIVGVLAAAATP